MFSLVSASRPATTWLDGRTSLSLPAETEFEIRTKDKNGPWVTVLEAEVPNNKLWEVQVSIHVDETEE
jgi:hypothetical protein